MRITPLLLLTVLAGLAPGALAGLVEIKPFQVCDDSGGNCATTQFFEAETDKIWAQAGIDVSFGSVTTLFETDWLSVSLGASGPAEHIEVMQAGRAENDPALTQIINMFFVDEIDPALGTIFGLGCGAPEFAGFCGGEVGVFISSAVFDFGGGAGRLDTIAHEIGHVLGLEHDEDGAGSSAASNAAGRANLMTAGTFPRTAPTSIGDIAPDGAGLAQLTDAQIAKVYTSSFVQVPAPAVPLLLATALFGLGVRRRVAVLS